MPCFEPPRPDAYRSDVLKEVRHNSDIAQLLCEACRALDIKTMSPALQKWWEEHQERDTLIKAVQSASGAKLDYLGVKKEVFRFFNESDDRYRKRILPRYL